MLIASSLFPFRNYLLNSGLYFFLRCLRFLFFLIGVVSLLFLASRCLSFILAASENPLYSSFLGFFFSSFPFDFFPRCLPFQFSDLYLCFFNYAASLRSSLCNYSFFPRSRRNPPLLFSSMFSIVHSLRFTALSPLRLRQFFTLPLFHYSLSFFTSFTLFCIPPTPPTRFVPRFSRKFPDSHVLLYFSLSPCFSLFFLHPPPPSRFLSF